MLMNQLKLVLFFLVVLTLIHFFYTYFYKPSVKETSDHIYYDLQYVLAKWYTFSEEDFVLNGPHIEQNDPLLVERLQSKFLISPLPQTIPYNLDLPDEDPSMGQSVKIQEILKYKRNGFFIECGALDGETRSNSLIFERKYNWTGILIEADPKNFKQMLNKHRKSYLSPTCLSIQAYPSIMNFKQEFNTGKLSDNPVGYKEEGFVDVQCFPLYTYLLALKVKTVDYFSLDVEGNELEVLKTIPWDLVDIKALSVEFIHGVSGKDALRHYMEQKGYTLESEITHPNNLANDFIFFKNNM